MSFDSWKSTDRADEWLGPEPDEEPPAKTLGEHAFEAFWAREWPQNLTGTGWAGLSPETQQAWEQVGRRLTELGKK
jgi:hypothetical protein